MSSEEPKEWSKLLPVAQWWYNTNYHTAAQITPYEVMFNQPLPLHLPYLPGETKNALVERTLQRREAMIHLLMFHLLRAQHRMKLLTDAHRTDRTFQGGIGCGSNCSPTDKALSNSGLMRRSVPSILGRFKLKPRWVKWLTPSTSRQQPKYTIRSLSLIHI